MKLIFQRISISLALIFIVVSCVCIQSISADTTVLFDDELDELDHVVNSTHAVRVRDGRVFPFLTFVKLGTEKCGNSKGQGVCKLKKQCDSDSGTDLGISCGNGFGTCCSIMTTCSATNPGKPIVIKNSGTHITQPPSYTPPTSCRVQLKRPKGVCQVRLDFVAFNLAFPNAIGDCDNDSLTISGAANLGNFVTCGVNNGQHLYLDYGGSDTISLSFILNAAQSNYDILVTYIPCDDSCTSSGGTTKKKTSKFSIGNKKKPSSSSNDNSTEVEKAPEGCAQYFTEPTGVVQSFDYVKVTDVVSNAQTYQTNNQMYTVCFKTFSGSNQITWKKCSPDDNFFITGLTCGVQSMSGTSCQTDYIDFPGTPEGRYCGSDFPSSVTSTAKPYMMYVYFNKEEVAGLNNPVDPSTGCPTEHDCVDPSNGAPGPIPCPDLTWCLPDGFLAGRSDFFNSGFCLQYMIS